MKFSHKFELVGCNKNIITISISLDTDMQKDVFLFMEKIPEIEKLLMVKDKAQATIEQFSDEEKLKYDFQSSAFAKKMKEEETINKLQTEVDNFVDHVDNKVKVRKLG